MHASTAPRHRARRSVPARIGALLSTAGIVLVVTYAAVSSAGASFALWNDDNPVTPAVVQSGTLGLTVNDLASYSLDGTSWQRLLPGDSVRQQVTVKNTGNISATVAAATVASHPSLEVRVVKGACGSVIGGASSTSTTTALGGWAPGEAAIVCIQVSLASSAPQAAQGVPMTFTTTFTATQA